MDNKENKPSGAGEVQVFELTMDNPEDQDELNRRLRKPGEPAVESRTTLAEPAAATDRGRS